jgi:glycosyltransferase involved in cell wall biosynthesis
LAGDTSDRDQLEPIRAAVRNTGLDDRVFFLGRVEDDQLRSIYSLAQALVLPSLSEGFGLPALEAMACGCPVLAARATSLPEVVGPAGIYFDPESVDDMAEAMSKIMTEPGLTGRLTTLGLAQAARFSWEKTATAVSEVYREVLRSCLKGNGGR